MTLWVQFAGDKKTIWFGDLGQDKKVLILYNPDPIYNLDEQVCSGFAKGLASKKCYVKVSSVKSSDETAKNYDCIVFCSNTYNWSPDWLISKKIKKMKDLNGKRAIAITLGSGSTKRSRRLLEKEIKEAGALLEGSYEFWLLRPNDESRMDEKNTDVAVDMAFTAGVRTSEILDGESD